MEVRTLRLWPETIAVGLSVGEEVLPHLFMDGRTAQPFCEVWAAEAFGFPPRLKRQQSGLYLVKAMTANGFDLSPSSSRGINRARAKIDQVQAYLGQFEGLVVCDVAGFPTIHLYRLEAHHADELVAGGKEVSRGRFLQLCRRAGVVPDA